MQGTLIINNTKYENVMLVSIGDTDGVCIHCPEKEEEAGTVIVLKEVRWHVTGTEIELTGYRPGEEHTQIDVRFRPYGKKSKRKRNDLLLTEEETQELKELLDEMDAFSEMNLPEEQTIDLKPKTLQMLEQKTRTFMEKEYFFPYSN